MQQRKTCTLMQSHRSLSLNSKERSRVEQLFTREDRDEDTGCIGVCCPYHRHRKRPPNRGEDLSLASPVSGIFLGVHGQTPPIYWLRRKMGPYRTRSISSPATLLHGKSHNQYHVIHGNYHDHTIIIGIDRDNCTVYV